MMASNVNAIMNTPPSSGKFFTILSIDGGGVRGIVPGVVLEFHELKLQVRILSYLQIVTHLHVMLEYRKYANFTSILKFWCST